MDASDYQANPESAPPVIPKSLWSLPTTLNVFLIEDHKKTPVALHQSLPQTLNVSPPLDTSAGISLDTSLEDSRNVSYAFWRQTSDVLPALKTSLEDYIGVLGALNRRPSSAPTLLSRSVPISIFDSFSQKTEIQVTPKA